MMIDAWMACHVSPGSTEEEEDGEEREDELNSLPRLVNYCTHIY
jgi:hypothetical protein